MADHKLILWGGFHVIIAILLACDFLLFQRHAGKIHLKKAWILSAFWILIALIFNGLIYYTHGPKSALEFFTSYLVEKSLSVDNLFVFLMIFTTLHIPESHERKVLFWGILGAIIFRIVFILIGIKLLALFHWMTYLLGGFLCFTGIKLMTHVADGPKKPDPEHNFIVRFFRLFFPLAKGSRKNSFFIRENGLLKMTMLFLALVLIESTDILFALDSIPAVLAITTDPFIAYTSNIFAILGLRALFFALCPFLKKFKYFNWGLSAILIFVGVKMLLSQVIAVPLLVSLLVIACILVATALFSWVKVRR